MKNFEGMINEPAKDVKARTENGLASGTWKFINGTWKFLGWLCTVENNDPRDHPNYCSHCEHICGSRNCGCESQNLGAGGGMGIMSHICGCNNGGQCED